jgi:hypothetical protein
VEYIKLRDQGVIEQWSRRVGIARDYDGSVAIVLNIRIDEREYMLGLSPTDAIELARELAERTEALAREQLRRPDRSPRAEDEP